MELEQNILAEFDISNKLGTYWLIRTSGGEFYDVFRNHNFVGIGWDFITNRDLNTLSDNQIREKIERDYNTYYNNNDPIDFNSQYGRTLASGILKKLRRFAELERGDVIIIPSAGSQFISFGIINDESSYDKVEDDRCEFQKRRRVNWITTKELRNLDPTFYKILNSKHAISSLEEYSSFIDREIQGLFIKDGYGHLVLNVRKEEDIPISSLLSVIENTKRTISTLNEALNLNEVIDDSSIKISMQSPGQIEFKFREGISAILFGVLVMSFSSCTQAKGSPLENNNQDIEMVENEVSTNLERRGIDREVIDIVKETIPITFDNFNTTTQSLDSLQADIEYLNAM